MKNVVINGRVLLLPMNGIPRYAAEIVKQLDNNLPNDINLEVVIPENESPSISLHKCRYVRLPNGLAWDYTKAERYAKGKRALYINLASKGVLYKNSIVTIHDIRPISYDPKPKNIKEARNYKKFKISFNMATKNAKHIVTVSEFCKKEILNYCHRKQEDISIIGDGWDHILEIEKDESIFEEYTQIKRNQYYLSIGSVAPHKNFKWIVENAKINPKEQYVIVGKTNTELWEDNTADFQNNIVYVGYQTDERLKSLLLNAKALVFPSLYEGFGIPPLEALGLGIPAIVSDIPVMREILGNDAIYIDPNCPNENIGKVLKGATNHYKECLNSHIWKHQGDQWIELIQNYVKDL